VATRIVHGSSTMASFTWEAVRDPQVLALASRVRVVEDPAMTRRLPQERPARVVVTDLQGRAHAAEVATNRGDDAAPYSQAELHAKFLDLCGRVWPRPHAEAVLAATLALCAGGSAPADDAALQAWLVLLRRPADR